MPSRPPDVVHNTTQVRSYIRSRWKSVVYDLTTESSEKLVAHSSERATERATERARRQDRAVSKLLPHVRSPSDLSGPGSHRRQRDQGGVDVARLRHETTAARILVLGCEPSQYADRKLGINCECGTVPFPPVRSYCFTDSHGTVAVMTADLEVSSPARKAR